MIRAMLNACRPCGIPQPQNTSSTSDGCTSWFRSSSSSMTKAPSSSGRTWASEPLKARPIGVRTVSTITASGISLSLIWIQSFGCAMVKRPALWDATWPLGCAHGGTQVLHAEGDAPRAPPRLSEAGERREDQADRVEGHQGGADGREGRLPGHRGEDRGREGEGL